MASDTASQRSIKGILKNKCSSASSEEAAAQESGGTLQDIRRKKSQKWDESSILATYHPARRDHDLMKINEPSSPNLKVKEEVSDAETKEALTSENLTGFMKKLDTIEIRDSSYQMEGLESYRAETSDALNKQEKQRQFELKRKLHYNEGLNIRLARQLISKELQVEDENEENLQGENKEEIKEESNEDLGTDEA